MTGILFATECLLGDCPTLTHAVCERLQAVEDAICGQRMAICKRMWCSQHRMCHSRCMLREWQRVTGDQRFQERAEHCAGRCGGWDLVPSTAAWWRGAAEWQGHWFVVCPDVDMSRLGYHHEGCPLRNDRNNLNIHTPMSCSTKVFDSKKRAWLQKCQRILRGMEDKNMSSKDMFKMALAVECMKEVVIDGKWIPEICQAQHVVDPWGIQPKTVVCQREVKPLSAVEAVQNLLKEFQVLLEFISAAAILHGLFAEKKPSKLTLGILPVTVLVPTPDSRQSKEDSQHEVADQEQEKQDSEELIQIVHHIEPAADIPEIEAQSFVDIQQADFVQRILDAAPLQAELQAELPRNDHLPEDIFKGRVNRMSKDTRQHFIEGAALRPCRDGLLAQGYEVEIQGGCLVFVHPWQYEDVLRAVANIPLTRADIIFAASFEYLVEQTLNLALEFGCRGSWMKSRDQLQMDESDRDDGEHYVGSDDKKESVEEKSDELLDGIIEIDRTFLRWRPVSEVASNPKPLTF